MVLKYTGLTALLFLFACDNGGDPSNGGNTGDSGGGDTTIGSTYEIEVDAVIEDSDVTATVYVNGEPIGNTGECLGLPDNYYGGQVTVTVGNDGAGETSDGLPLVKDPNGDRWVTPSKDVTPSSIDDRNAQCTSQEVKLNFYAGEDKEWTCSCELWGGNGSPAQLEYTDGHTLKLPGIGEAELSGKSLKSADGASIVAEFKSDKLIEGTTVGYDLTCSSN